MEQEQRIVLLHKKLSMSDLSDTVLLTGRIVLPRVQMELNADRVIEVGCKGSRRVDRDAGSAQYSLEVVDECNRRWGLLLKQWTAHSAPQPRPIFVLERTADCMRAHKASPGHFMQLWMAPDDGETLRISVLTPHQAASTASDWQGGAVTLASNVGLPILGQCRRSPGCNKGDGHPGFCSGGVTTHRSGGAFGGDTRSPRDRSNGGGGGGGRAHMHHASAMAYGCPPPAGETCPTWITIRCGAVRGDLHVESLSVTPIDHRGKPRAGGAVTLREFGNMGSGQYNTGPYEVDAPIIVEGAGMSLHRWLASWGYPYGSGAGAGLGLRATPADAGSPPISDSIDSDIEAGEVLLSMMSRGSGGRDHRNNFSEGRNGVQTTLRGAPTHHDASFPPQQQTAAPVEVKGPEELPVEDAGLFGSSSLPAPTAPQAAAVSAVKPQPQSATPSITSALYAQLAQESQMKSTVTTSPKTYETAVAALSRLDQLSKRAKLAKMLAAVASSRMQMGPSASVMHAQVPVPGFGGNTHYVSGAAPGAASGHY